jgi:hypothetical protein
MQRFKRLINILLRILEINNATRRTFRLYELQSCILNQRQFKFSRTAVCDSKPTKEETETKMQLHV